jgi:hypothetical protein
LNLELNLFCKYFAFSKLKISNREFAYLALCHKYPMLWQYLRCTNPDWTHSYDNQTGFYSPPQTSWWIRCPFNQWRMCRCTDSHYINHHNNSNLPLWFSSSLCRLFRFNRLLNETSILGLFLRNGYEQGFVICLQSLTDII